MRTSFILRHVFSLVVLVAVVVVVVVSKTHSAADPLLVFIVVLPLPVSVATAFSSQTFENVSKAICKTSILSVSPAEQSTFPVPPTTVPFDEETIPLAVAANPVPLIKDWSSLCPIIFSKVSKIYVEISIRQTDRQKKKNR